MARERILPTIVGILFIVAACGGGTATNAPAAASASQAPAGEASASAAGGEASPSAAGGEASPSAAGGEASPSAAAGGGAPCAPSNTAGTVAVKIANFAFDPAQVSAKVGDTVTWTNNDSTGHTATVDGNETCTTTTLENGASGSITFTQTGSYDFHCKIHPNMTGKIEVTG
jgi:plastocyanin